MLLPLAAALLLIADPQSSPPDRHEAERLARAGRTEEAMCLFARIAEQDPGDVEARLWLARLALRLGRTAEATAGFRAVLDEHPDDVDAQIGLGIALNRSGAWEQALNILQQAESAAGENADLFSALARAYRRAGDDRRALDYFTRARALAPRDPDVVEGYEALARIYGHKIALEGFTEGGAPGADAVSGSLALDVRVVPALHLQAAARVQQRSGITDTIGGAGAVWRFARATTAAVRALAGPDNASLPVGDLSGELIHYAGIFEAGGSVRYLSFAGADVLAASPTIAWDPGPQRLDARYTYSRSRFDDSGESRGDHSVMLRDTWRVWRRVSLSATYAYGIESFEDLTADRIESLGTTTVAGGLQVTLPSLTTFTTTWEHQWRTNETTIDRVTLSIVQALR
jgi:tetratricopeptide (TPR) repeat protein